jgi:ribosomal protein S18 acetylase RimI-like enzyme
MSPPSRTLIIRTASDDDLASVVAHYGAGGGDSPWDPFADSVRIRSVPRRGMLVAVLDGTYAGFLFWYEGRKLWYDPSVDRYARITDLHVVAKLRRRGVGRALLREALHRVHEEGIDDVFLETDDDNVQARGLYETEGFVGLPSHVARYHLRLGKGTSAK